MSRFTNYLNRKTGTYHLKIDRWIIEMIYPKYKSDFIPESKWKKEEKQRFIEAVTPVRGRCPCGFIMVMHRQDLRFYNCNCGYSGLFEEIK